MKMRSMMSTGWGMDGGGKRGHGSHRWLPWILVLTWALTSCTMKPDPPEQGSGSDLLLSDGATVSGPVQRGKKGLQLQAVNTVCGMAPEQYQKRTPFRNLVAINPSERFN